MLFLVHFIVGLVFGLIYLLIPDTFLGLFGVTIADSFPYRTIGAAVLAFSASSWYCYKADAWEKVKIVVQAEIVWTVLAALVGLYGLLILAQPPSFWINVIIMAGFAAAFVYFYTKK